LGQVAMPDLVGLPAHVDTLYLAPPLRVENADLNLLGVFREQCEVHAFPGPGGSQRIGLAGPDFRDELRELCQTTSPWLRGHSFPRHHGAATHAAKPGFPSVGRLLRLSQI